jgi:hypothetical protein
MKSRFLMCFTAIALFAVLAMPLRPAAQDKQETSNHHHYKPVDLKTFGGPQSWVFGRNEVTGRETIPSTPPVPTFKTLVCSK